MTYSTTVTNTKTFTLTDAKNLASKIAADLKRVKRFYANSLSDYSISQYEEEVTELLKHGYLESVTYGYKKNGKWIEPTLKYNAEELLNSEIDDDPGKIRPGKNTTSSQFCSFLTYTPAWFALSIKEREKFEDQLPLNRKVATEPSVSGYLENDRTYSSGGRSLTRQQVRSN